MLRKPTGTLSGRLIIYFLIVMLVPFILVVSYTALNYSRGIEGAVRGQAETALETDAYFIEAEIQEYRHKGQTYGPYKTPGKAVAQRQVIYYKNNGIHCGDPRHDYIASFIPASPPVADHPYRQKQKIDYQKSVNGTGKILQHTQVFHRYSISLWRKFTENLLLSYGQEEAEIEFFLF